MEVSKELGKELNLDLRLEGSDAVIIINHEGTLGSVKIEGKISLALLIDKLTDLIPGEWDDNLIDPLVAKFLAKKSE